MSSAEHKLREWGTETMCDDVVLIVILWIRFAM